MRHLPSLLCAWATLPLLASDWDRGLALALRAESAMNEALKQDVRRHQGLGIGLHVAAIPSEAHALRFNLDYTETHIASGLSNGRSPRSLFDTWMSMRLMVEHHMRLLDSRFGVFYGAGLRRVWMQRGETTPGYMVLAILGANGSGNPEPQTSSLHAWLPMASAGLSVKIADHSTLELRWLGGPYKRFQAEGLSTQGQSPTERRMGHTLELCWNIHLSQ